MYNGSMVALVTPMHQDGSIDINAFAALIEWHIHAKTQALIIAGTTGESATLDKEEHYKLLQFAVKCANGRIPIIAGTGTNATRSTIALTESAQTAGADAALIVTPYYNKPSQAGLYQHYKSVARQSKLPIILYNVPSRTACDLLPDTVAQLANIDNIIGIKEATGKIERLIELKAILPSSFKIYSGDDATALDFMLKGAQGVISVTANVVPEEMYKMSEAAYNNHAMDAIAINNRLAALHIKLFIEANPIPVKWALQQMGKISEGIRLPLLWLDKRYHKEVQNALQQAGVKINEYDSSNTYSNAHYELK